MKAYLKARVERRKEHLKNLVHLPEETHRINGWAELIVHTGYYREILERWIKLYDFPKPEFHYRKRMNHWRRMAIWDKRQVGDWFKTNEELIK